MVAAPSGRRHATEGYVTFILLPKLRHTEQRAFAELQNRAEVAHGCTKDGLDSKD